jgi:hypothetical protein
MRRIAHRDVQLVRRDHAQRRVLELPPPLVADDADLDGVRGRRGGLDLEGGARRRRDQDEDDEDRHDGPRQLDRIAAVDLRRLASVVPGTATVANETVDEQPADDHEDDASDRQHEQ